MSMRKTNQISDSELELMKIIWAKGGRALYADLMNELEKKENTWNKNTVLTLLSRLMEKGLLQTNKIGRKNEYQAIITEQQYVASQTKHFLDKLYRGNAKGLVSTLVEEEYLSSDDFAELVQFWNDGKDLKD